MKNIKVQKADGKLGVLVVGLSGAVSSTFIAGTYAIRKGVSKPIGSLSQMATIRLGKRNENRFPKIKDIVPLAELKDIVFGGWDIIDENLYTSCKYANVLQDKELDVIKGELEKIKPMKAAFNQKYVKRLDGEWVKKEQNKWKLMEEIREDIRKFKKENNCSRLVMIWCGSTEIFIIPSDVHSSLAKLEEGMKNNHELIAPSILYAYAALSEGVPYINGAPNLTVDTIGLRELADKNNVPIAGKDFKTGQTMLKTVLAPMFKARMLGVSGWYSTNILGNRDGAVLDDPESFKTKEESKLSVIDTILQPELYPDLYKEIFHKVRINYYPPRGDDKESWDNIDIFGWLGYPMQMKVNFLCRDSILAAPICLDLVLFMDLAQRCGFKGIQTWLSFYLKSPMHDENTIAEHDLFIQQVKLKNTLRVIAGEQPVDFLDESEDIFS